MRRATWSAVADTAAVLAFVVVGRRSHDGGGNVVVEAAKVAAPFLIALVVAWLAVRAWRDPLCWRRGVVVWLVTVVTGLLLRRVVFDRSTALAFAIVATLVLGVLINGWRAVARVRAVRKGRTEVRGNLTAPTS